MYYFSPPSPLITLYNTDSGKSLSFTRERIERKRGKKRGRVIKKRIITTKNIIDKERKK